MSFSAKLKTFDSWRFFDFYTMDRCNVSNLTGRRPADLLSSGKSIVFVVVQKLRWNFPSLLSPKTIVSVPLIETENVLKQTSSSD